MNSKTNLVKTAQDDPYSPAVASTSGRARYACERRTWWGPGATIYLGSEYESTMLAEAGQLIAEAHAAGLLVVLWIYPRGKAVADEKAPALIAGAAGVALCLGADFVKVNPPKATDEATSAENFSQSLPPLLAVRALCALAAPPSTPKRSSRSCMIRSMLAMPAATRLVATFTSASTRPCV